jgi:NAD(P)-dependent dehydrogenase (short-subunit alcohol dehydrogenase family)
MPTVNLPEPTATAYNFRGRTIFITGGFGVLGSAMAAALAAHGANVALLSRHPDAPARLSQHFGDLLARPASPGSTASPSSTGAADPHLTPPPPANEPSGNLPAPLSGQLFAVTGDVLDPTSLTAAVDATIARFGPIDGLINAAGGNHPDAITNPTRTFFDLPPAILRGVFDLNLLGTLLPSQIVGRHMAARGAGVILNLTSMAALTPLTRVVAYSAAKAAVSNFTQWLAVHLAQEYSPAIRVNALAPGFFLGAQNRDLLIDRASGSLTPRGRQIIDHTPQGRFGDPADLIGPMLWLMSPASAFVTGIVVPVDGGFSAYAGV